MQEIKNGIDRTHLNSNMFVNPELTQSIDENFIDMIF